MDIASIYKDLHKDRNVLECFFSLQYNLYFDELGRCTTNRALAIVRGEQGYYIKNHGQKLDIPNGNLSKQIYHVTKHLSGTERLSKQLGIIEQVSKIDTIKAAFKSHLNSDLTGGVPATAPKREKPNFTTFGSYCGKSVLSYFRNKTGATKATLSKYGIKPIRSRTTANLKTLKHGSDNFAFAYVANQHIKIKQPNPSGNFYDWIRGKETYCFGLEQLPQKGKNLIIASGEDDALCINHHAKIGTYAVSFGGENNKLDAEIINSLKKRFDRVFICYDNDSVGISKSLEYSANLGLVWVDLDNALNYYNLSNCKDICNVYERLTNKAEMPQFINYLTESNGRLEADPNDPFSITINHHFKFEFPEYIGTNSANKMGINPIEFLERQLEQHRRLILQANAGTGKSTWIYNLIQTANIPTMEYINDYLGCEKLIVAEPTTSIAQQLYNSFLEKGLKRDSIALVMGTESKTKTRGNVDKAKVLIVVYDSLGKVGEYVDSSLLIVDEYHQLVNDKGYRVEAMNLLYRAMKEAKKTLLLSATPNYIFTTDWHKDFNYKLIIAKAQKSNTLELFPKVHKCPKSRLFEYVEMNANKSGTVCIKVDNNTHIEAFGELCRKRNITFEHLTSSKGRKYKEENPNYQSIMENGLLKNDVRFLCYTTLLEAGVSFRFPVSEVNIFDTKSRHKIVQLASRPRHNFTSGVNTNTKVNLFVTDTEPNAEQNPKGIKERFLEELKRATNHAQELNNYRASIDKTKLKRFDTNKRKYKAKTDLERLIYIAFDGTYQPDISAILYELYKQETQEANLDLLLRRIKRFDDRFTVHPIEYIDPNDNNEIKAILEGVKATKEESKEAFEQLINSSTTQTIQAVVYLSKDAEFKTKIKGAFLLPELDKEATKQHIEATPKAFKGREPKRIIKRAYDLVRLGTNTHKSIQLATTADKAEVDRYIEQMTIKKRCSAIRKNLALAEIDKAEIKKYRILVKKGRQLAKNAINGIRKNQFTSQELATLINRWLAPVTKGKTLSQKKAIEQLKPIYDLEYKRIRVGNKRQYVWVFKSSQQAKINTPK